MEWGEREAEKGKMGRDGERKGEEKRRGRTWNG